MTGVAVCTAVASKVGVCSSLSSASEIGINIDTVTGDADCAEAAPDVTIGFGRYLVCWVQKW